MIRGGGGGATLLVLVVLLALQLSILGRFLAYGLWIVMMMVSFFFWHSDASLSDFCVFFPWKEINGNLTVNGKNGQARFETGKWVTGRHPSKKVQI
jgi:hypothetical protein